VDRGEITNRTPTRFQHRLNHPLDQEELGTKVDVKEKIELLAGNFEEGSVESDARIVYKTADPPEELSGLLRQREHLIDVLEIRLNDTGAPSHGSYLFSCRLRT